MEAADLPAALALWAESEGVEISAGDSPEELRRYLAMNAGLSQIALAAGQLIGAVLVGQDGRRGYLYHLAVASRHRSARVGSQLVARSLDALRRHGIKRTLILVERENAGGASFWVRQGWERLEAADAMGIDL